jgi:hypothetical protein
VLINVKMKCVCCRCQLSKQCGGNFPSVSAICSCVTARQTVVDLTAMMKTAMFAVWA